MKKNQKKKLRIVNKNMDVKKLIVDGLKEQLDKLPGNYTELFLNFDLTDNTCEGTLVLEDQSSESYPIDKKDISKIRKLFINKILREHKRKGEDKRELARLILNFDLINSEMKLFGEPVDETILIQIF